MASNNVIGIPTDDSDFEDKCVALFACVCGDPNFKKIGTGGKNQGGLDLIGTRNQNPEVAVGVQCKLITKRGKLDLNQITSDIERALLFDPPLSEIYVATTASDDIKYDQLALKLRQKQKKAGRIVDIQIWGWDTLQGHIRKYADARNAFDPDYSASTQILLNTTFETLAGVNEARSTLALIESEKSESSVKISELHAAFVTGDTTERVEIEKLLDNQIDGFRNLLNNGRPRSALTLLEDFEAHLPSNASAAIRSRVRANIGFAKLKLSDDQGCAIALRQAFEINPGDAKAQANSLLADILDGHIDTALARAKMMVGQSPPNTFAASYIYQAASALEADIEADDIVPSELRVDENSGINRVNYYRKHRGDTWWTVARELADSLPNNEIAQRFDAEAKLEQALRYHQLPATTKGGASRREQITLAALALQKHWDVVRNYENASDEVWLSVGINLSTAYRALRDFKNAETIIGQAANIDPNNIEVLLAGAHLDLIFDRAQDAVTKAEGLPDSPSRTIVLASAYGELDRWDEAVNLITPERLSAIAPDDRALVDCILVRGQAEATTEDEAQLLIKRLLDRWPNDNRVRIVAADLAYRKAPEIAAELLQTATSNLSNDSRYADRVMVAECALRHNDFGSVIAALDGFIETEVLNEPLSWLALAFVNSPIRPRTAEFFAELGPDVISTPRFARLAGFLDCHRGELRSAERHLSLAFSGDPTDLRSLLMLQSTLERSGKREEAKKLVVEIDEYKLEGDPRDQMMLSAILGHYGESERALKLGYLVAAYNRNDERIACRYPGMLFSSKAQGALVKRGGTIEVGDWFLLKSPDGEQIEGLISTDDTPEIQNFSPDHAFAIQIVGASQNQIISIEQPFSKPKDFLVEEVKSKYLWLLDDITRSHATRFPGSVSIGTMTMQDGDIQPVLDVVKASVESDRAILEFYEQQPVPIELLAAMHNKSPISVAELILHYGGEIDTCVGSNEEREIAMQLARQAAGKGAVIDTDTAWCLLHFDLLEPFRNHFGKLVIAQSTIDDLLEIRGREELNLDQEYLTLGFEGEQAVRQIHSPDETKVRVAGIGQAIDKLREYCEILPIDGFDDIEFTSLLHHETIAQSLHAIQLSKHHALFLLSDDIRLRQMNEVYGSKKSGWIQATAQLLASNAQIDARAYAKVVGNLAARKHGYVSVNGETLVGVLCMETPHADAYFNLVAEYIGGPKAEILSHVSVVADFMCRVWSSSVSSWRKGRACGKLIESLIRHRNEDWPGILALLERQITNVHVSVDMRPDHGKAYLNDWIDGHFSRPSFNRFMKSILAKKKRNGS
ncbi:PIN domain-containing protein [Sphingorhabdus contaminans]|uniref:PIN domain-containing protein n=1 Tax=Sphingorhabdus contaminans TaxID=1343899 RepID=A0A553WK58_9SPHN|nr:hypothetical protein [Sphingorhabdus contaminans]TSB05072.1 hypothetical protein FOM92_06750 [Sphingorhabdus contaminans]